MAFTRQLHPVEGQIRILRIWNSNARNGNGIQPHSHREAQLAKVILQLANLELNVRKWIPSCEINLRDFRKSPCNVQNLHAN